MSEHEQQYQWYLAGADRLGDTPVSRTEFETRWLALEEHAETLKTADAQGRLLNLDAEEREIRQRQMKDDPFVRAVLVGRAEAEQ